MSEFPYTEPISDYIQGYQIGFEDGRADREREICDFLRKLSNGDDINAKLVKLIEQKEVEERKKGYDEGYQQCRAEFEPLLKILVDMESDYICDDLSSTEYCEENCKYSCPQKECYLEYLKELKG